MKSFLKRSIPFLITAFFLWLVLRKVDMDLLAQSLGEVDYKLLPLVALVYLAGFLPRAYKWKLILRQVAPVSLGATLRYTLMGCAGNAILPARLGEFLRAYVCGRREGCGGTAVFSTIILERALEVLSLLVLFSGVIWLYGQVQLRAVAALGLLGCLAGLVLLFFMQRGRAWLDRLMSLLPWPGMRQRLSATLQRLLEGLAVLNHFSGVLAILALGLLVYGLEGAAYWLAAGACGIEISYGQALFVLCFIFVGMLIPAGAGNVGPLQYFGMLGLSFFGADPNRSLLFTVLINAMMYLPALWGLLYIWREGISLKTLRHGLNPETVCRADGAEDGA